MTGFKKTLAGAMTIGLMLPTFAFADSSTSSIQALLEQLKALQMQIVAIQGQQQTVMINLATTLKQGSKGDNVKTLQQLLAQDPSVYPEGLVSGFFGPKTAKAVRRFQKKHGLDQVGDVGPKTAKMLNQLFSHAGTSTHEQEDADNDKHENDQNDDHGKPCSTPPGHMTAPGWLKNWGKDGKKDRDFPGKGRGSDDCPPMGTTTPPVVDMTAPIITGISANAITTTGANIIWMTNENATSQVEFGTTTAYGSMTVFDSTLMMSHMVSLTGLTPSMMYHFRVLSKDAANNLATSSDMNFMTVASDMTAPVISGAAVSGIGSTTASIGWNTNEAATGKVYYSTTTPVNLSTALMVNNGALVTTHLFNLMGLTASSTYYFVLESKDAANNTATTSSSSFMTN